MFNPSIKCTKYTNIINTRLIYLCDTLDLTVITYTSNIINCLDMYHLVLICIIFSFGRLEANDLIENI